MAYNRTLTSRPFIPYATSRDPNGTEPAPESPFRIIGTVADGNEVTLTTASLNFGGIAPEFVRRVLLQPAQAGQDYIPQNGVNYEVGRLAKNGFYYQSANSALRIPVHAVSGMPSGVALAVGDKSPDQIGGDSSTTSSLNVETSKYFTETFEHCYFYFPDTNQEAMRTAIAGGANLEVFNVKLNWVGREGEVYGGVDTNIYNGIFRYNAANNPSQMFLNPTLRVSNVSSQGTATLPSTGTGINAAINSAPNNKILPHPICCQTASKINGVDGYDWIKLVANRTGENPQLCDYLAQNLAINTYPMDYPVVELRGQPFSNEFNQQKLFGFIRGYGINFGFNYYMADHFLQFGSGARARVEIYEKDSTFAINKRISVMRPLYWSPSGKEVAFKVSAGIFSGESLSGKWLRVYNYLGQFVGERQIP